MRRLGPAHPTAAGREDRCATAVRRNEREVAPLGLFTRLRARIPQSDLTRVDRRAQSLSGSGPLTIIIEETDVDDGEPGGMYGAESDDWLSDDSSVGV